MPEKERLQALGNACPVQMSAWIGERLREQYKVHYNGVDNRALEGAHVWPHAA